MNSKSCLTNLLETFEDWTRAVDEGHGIDVIYLDYIAKLLTLSLIVDWFLSSKHMICMEIF